MTQIVVVALVVCIVIVLSSVAVALRHLLWRDNSSASNNNAESTHNIELAGYVFGAIVVTAAAISAVSLTDQSVSMAITEGEFSLWDFGGSVLVYGLLTMVLFALSSRMSVERLLRIDSHLAVRAENTAVAVVSAASAVAHALILAAAISGETESPGPLPPLFFSILGLAVLWLCTWIFRLLTSYDDTRELVHNNVAASLSYGGLMIAIGMIVAHAVEGDFSSWEESLWLFGRSMVPIVLLYPLRQFVLQSLILRRPLRLYGGALDDEISLQQNVGAGALEAAGYISAAFLICRVAA